LKRLNPDLQVFGLYGGRSGRYPDPRGRVLRRLLADTFDDVYVLQDRPFWNWANGDLAMRSWHRDVGRHASFDVLHLFEWDLLFLDSLGSVYAGVPTSAVGLAGLTPFDRVSGRWTWVTDEYRAQLDELLGVVRAKYDYDSIVCACLAIGAVFPRGFVDAYAAADVPELCHDEVRLPLFAQALGYEVVDTGMYDDWPEAGGAPDNRFFHASRTPIPLPAIEAELRRPHGRRTFHPFTGVFPDPERPWRDRADSAARRVVQITRPLARAARPLKQLTGRRR
jgi:hypothetical protein